MMTGHCEHTHSHDEALSPLTLADRLSAAQNQCEAAGERMTSSRLRTLELILSAQGPVKAYEVIDRFHDEGAAKPPTVYRALGFLEQMGLIHRIESLNAFVACHTHEAAHQAAFLLCECCGKSEEVSIHHAPEIEAAARHSGFSIRHVTLEARGLCKACQ